MKTVLLLFIGLFLTKSLFGQICENTITTDKSDVKKEDFLFSMTKLAKELSSYKNYTIGLEPITSDLIHGAIDDYAAILSSISPDFSKDIIIKRVVRNIKKFGPELGLIAPALELIEQAYILERPEFSAPLIGVIGRANPHMGFVLLRSLRKDDWGFARSRIPGRDAMLFTSRNIFGSEIEIFSENSILPALQGTISLDAVNSIQSFFGEITAKSWIESDFQKSTIPIFKGRMDSLYRFDSFSKRVNPDFSKSPFANYTDRKGIIIDRNYQYMSSGSGTTNMLAKVAWHYSKEVAKKMPLKVADTIYSENWRTFTYTAIGAAEGIIVGAILTKNPWGTGLAAVSSGAIAYQESQNRSPEWEHDRHIYFINRDYDQTVPGSKAETLSAEHLAARRDFAKTMANDPENSGAVDSSGIVQPDRLTLEARQAYDRLELRLRHENEDLEFEKKQRIYYENKRYELDEKLGKSEISDAQYKEEMTNLGKQQDSEKNEHEARQSRERKEQNEAQVDACEAAGACTDEFKEVENQWTSDCNSPYNTELPRHCSNVDAGYALGWSIKFRAERLAQYILLDPAKEGTKPGQLSGICSRGVADAVWKDYERAKVCDPKLCDPADPIHGLEIWKTPVTIKVNIPVFNNPRGPGVVDPPKPGSESGALQPQFTGTSSGSIGPVSPSAPRIQPRPGVRDFAAPLSEIDISKRCSPAQCAPKPVMPSRDLLNLGKPGLSLPGMNHMPGIGRGNLGGFGGGTGGGFGGGGS